MSLSKGLIEAEIKKLEKQLELTFCERRSAQRDIDFLEGQISQLKQDLADLQAAQETREESENDTTG